MKRITVLSLSYLCILITFVSSQSNFNQTNNNTETHLKEVKEINGKAKLDEYFSKNKRAIIEIYAPWCHHCQIFAPIYKQLYNEVKNSINEVYK